MFKWLVRVLLLFIIIGFISFIWIYASLPDVEFLKSNNPETTAIFQQRLNEAESASRYYFGKSVGSLSTEEMIRLTAIIPRPLKTRPNSNSKWLYWKCCWITKKLYLYKYIDKPAYFRLLAKFC